MSRLTELSQTYHTHPDGGDDYLSLFGLNELCQLQHAEIERLSIAMDRVKDCELDLVQFTESPFGQASWYECLLCHRRHPDTPNAMFTFKHAADCPLAAEAAEETGK